MRVPWVYQFTRNYMRHVVQFRFAGFLGHLYTPDRSDSGLTPAVFVTTIKIAGNINVCHFCFDDKSEEGDLEPSISDSNKYLEM